MSEMDDMLKSMSKSMKSLHETEFKMDSHSDNERNADVLNDMIGINEEEQRNVGFGVYMFSEEASPEFHQ